MAHRPHDEAQIDDATYSLMYRLRGGRNRNAERWLAVPVGGTETVVLEWKQGRWSLWELDQHG